MKKGINKILEEFDKKFGKFLISWNNPDSVKTEDLKSEFGGIIGVNSNYNFKNKSKEIKSFLTQSIKQAFEETRIEKKDEGMRGVSTATEVRIKQNNFIYNQAIKDQKIARDKYLKGE